jgi:ornithine cyclodeaminase/alanine dehydrogenase-like protein (mu-crystallin family)
VNSAEAALAGADLIATITTASGPVFDGKLLQPGTHINAAGSNAAVRIELDLATIRRCDAIFTDDLAQARIESGNLITANERNAFAWEQLRPLADVVAGRTTGRPAPESITLFESHGIALWDVALAVTIYERAVEKNIGTLVELGV